MISEAHQCIFVHIPKTAGQSIEQFFLGQLGLSWRRRRALMLKRNRDPGKGPERLAHLTAAEYVECGYVTREQFDQYYTFSFVRNPWARLVSEYRFRQRLQPVPFHDFILSVTPSPASFSDEQRHVLSQYDYLYSREGELLVDFVGRFENLQADFDKVCLALGLAESVLPHVNTAANPRSWMGKIKKVIRQEKALDSKKHYTEYYTDELRYIVAERYAKSIEVFGYSFGQQE